MSITNDLLALRDELDHDINLNLRDNMMISKKK
jgi:hypothetical protein